jgi:LmbE family N-acetylglucosaminyl deacetylase
VAVPRTCLIALAAAIQFAAAARTVSAQTATRPASPDRSLAQLRRSLDGLTTTARVLIVGMHPDDELPELSTYLSLGKHVETAYLSITRGEAGEDFNGPESGTSLGVLRVAEALNARRIDGAHQYFTRAFDFGPVRTVNDVFLTPVDDTTLTGHWERDSVIADVVTIIRAFRPQVIIGVSGDTIAAGNGQHLALTSLLNLAFANAGDTTRFGIRRYGAPWPVAKLYRVGTGIRIATSELDRITGRTYPSLARDVRAQQRTQGPAVIAHAVSDTVGLELIASRVNREAPDSSLFNAVDTSFARIARGASPELSQTIERIAAVADSVRLMIDVTHPAAAVAPLARLAQLAATLRHQVASCAHVNISPAISVVAIRAERVCDAGELDRDAAADLIHDRASDALLAAAGVEISAIADRELLARLDTATVTVTIANHGAQLIRLGALSIHGAIADTAAPRALDIAPNGVVTLQRRVVRAMSLDPWWLGGRRFSDRYPDMSWPRDGLLREGAPRSLLISAQAIPEEIRRASDVSYLLEIGEATITGSIGPALYRHSDPLVGTQYRQLAGVPAMTISFARNLEWFPISKPVNRVLRVKAKSNADHPLLVGLGKAADPGINVDRVPKELNLEPHQQHEILVPLRGNITKQQRGQFLLWAATRDTTYQFGVQEIGRDYLEPTRVLRPAGAFMQGVDVTVPANLTVLYVPEGVDDIRSTLTQVGAFAREVSPDVLLTADLTNVSTIVLAPHIVERFPEIGAQAAHLLDFVRGGGTVVIQRGGDTTLASKLLPFPVSNSTPAQAVLETDAPVKVLDPQSRLLTWPNRIATKDWNGWVTARAESVPTVADPRYQRVIETHDPEQPANSNAILVAHIGKGTLIYTSLTFDQQLAGGVPGALRVFVNLLSAGLAR